MKTLSCTTFLAVQVVEESSFSLRAAGSIMLLLRKRTHTHQEEFWGLLRWLGVFMLTNCPTCLPKPSVPSYFRLINPHSFLDACISRLSFLRFSRPGETPKTWFPIWSVVLVSNYNYKATVPSWNMRLVCLANKKTLAS